MGKGTKRKKSDYYSHPKSKKSKSLFTLEPGLKGFICTCNNREKECVRESYNILNEYADQIYGEEKWEKKSKLDNVESSDEDDIDKALQQEVDHLKAERVKEPSLRRFQVVESGANNCLFIRTTIDDPVKLTSTLLKDLDETKKQKTCYLLRMLPIEATCKAWPEDIRQAIDELLDKYFVGGEQKSFSVIFNRRNNNNVPRDEVIRDIAAGVRERNALHYTDLKNPQYSIIVEIIRNMCCLAVVPDYFKYRRYNLLEVCSFQNTTNVSNDKKETSISDDAVGKQDETGSSDVAVVNEDVPSDCGTAVVKGEEPSVKETVVVNEEEPSDKETAVVKDEERIDKETALVKEE